LCVCTENWVTFWFVSSSLARVFTLSYILVLSSHYTRYFALSPIGFTKSQRRRSILRNVGTWRKMQFSLSKTACVPCRWLAVSVEFVAVKRSTKSVCYCKGKECCTRQVQCCLIVFRGHRSLRISCYLAPVRHWDVQSPWDILARRHVSNLAMNASFWIWMPATVNCIKCDRSSTTTTTTTTTTSIRPNKFPACFEVTWAGEPLEESISSKIVKYLSIVGTGCAHFIDVSELIKGWECWRRGRWREYFNLRGRKWWEAGENNKPRSFVTCKLHQILLQWSKRGIWDECGM